MYALTRSIPECAGDRLEKGCLHVSAITYLYQPCRSRLHMPINRESRPCNNKCLKIAPTVYTSTYLDRVGLVSSSQVKFPSITDMASSSPIVFACKWKTHVINSGMESMKCSMWSCTESPLILNVKAFSTTAWNLMFLLQKKLVVSQQWQSHLKL